MVAPRSPFALTRAGDNARRERLADNWLRTNVRHRPRAPSGRQTSDGWAPMLARTAELECDREPGVAAADDDDVPHGKAWRLQELWTEL